jgi:hypothetical protein
MIARHKISFFPLLLLLMGLVGCKVDSINPISSLDSSQPDEALYGVWRYQAKGELTYVHIGPEFSLSIGDSAAAASKRTRIILIDHKPNGITDEAHLAHESRIGKQRYLNVVQVEEGKPVGFVFVQYTLIDHNTLRFSTINDEVLKAAISAGRIKGTIRGEGLASETAITAESGEIENFLGHDGGKLFAKPLVLRRVQDR